MMKSNSGSLTACSTVLSLARQIVLEYGGKPLREWRLVNNRNDDSKLAGVVATTIIVPSNASNCLHSKFYTRFIMKSRI